MQIAGTTAVVTGAASGLGAATAAKLSTLGTTVFGFDRKSLSNGTASALQGVSLLSVDVTDPDSVRSGFETACAADAPLRIVVNCAGIAPSARILSRSGTHDLELFESVIRVNLLGTFNMLVLGAERIAANSPDGHGQRGVVINTASIAGYEPQIGQVAYGSSKGAVISMTLAAARDLAQRGIRVNSIAPGVMDSPMVAGFPQDVRDTLAATVPFPARLGAPPEFADLAAFLITHDYMNGEVVRMDGALRMTAQ